MELTAANERIPAWSELTDDDWMVGTRLFEAYAAMATHVDEQTGRLRGALEDQGILDDTLVLNLLGDNGASAEAGAYGTFNEMAYQNNVLMTTADIKPRLDEIGGPTAFNHMPAGWAHAMNTPYQWSKIVASHWGGIPAPEQVNGIEQRPLEGVGFKYAIDDADADELHRTQYFKIGANRGIYHDGWTAVTQHWLPWPDPDDQVPALTDDTWELYGPDDWTQAHDLAAEQPEKLRELQPRFLLEGAKYNVLPLDDRQRERFDPKVAGRPDLMAGRTSMTLHPGCPASTRTRS